MLEKKQIKKKNHKKKDFFNYFPSLCAMRGATGTDAYALVEFFLGSRWGRNKDQWVDISYGGIRKLEDEGSLPALAEQLRGRGWT